MLLFVTFYLLEGVYKSSDSMIIKGFIVYVLTSFITSVIVNEDIRYIIRGEVKDDLITINLIRLINYQKENVFWITWEFNVQLYGYIF